MAIKRRKPTNSASRFKEYSSFEEITRLEEYYPTRTERGMLVAWMPALIRRLGTRTLVELGAGSAEKTRIKFCSMFWGSIRRRSSITRCRRRVWTINFMSCCSSIPRSRSGC